MTQAVSNYVMNPQQAQQRWMDKPTGDSSGLSYLKILDALKVKQVVSVTEALLGIPSQSKFGVFNDRGEQVYFAFEESNFCERLCCPTTRAFDLHVVDKFNQEVIRVRRDFKCYAGCCWCACLDGCKQEVFIESPPGAVLGSVSQECSCWHMKYMLKDTTGNPVMYIKGPDCICDGPYALCCENKFTLFGNDETTEIGAIYKNYRGFFAEALTSADAFTMKVPLNLDVKMKALTLGALFLIDFALFSRPPE